MGSEMCIRDRDGAVDRSFSEGLAAVRLEGKWAYVDKFGKIQINPKFSSASIFRSGIASVKLNGKWAYIDKSGRTIWSQLN